MSELTQEQIEAYNQKARQWTNKHTETLFDLPEKSDKQIEYEKQLSKQKKPATREDVKATFFHYMVLKCLKSREEVLSIIKPEQDYIDACKIFVDYLFDPDSLSEGGIWLFSEPGVGKSTILISAFNTHQALQYGERNYNDWPAWSNMKTDISNHVNGKEVDLTYLKQNTLYLDEFTERINQCNKYDYKFSLNEVIDNRYDLWLSKGLKTFVTSNIHPEQPGIEKFMDSRSTSRIKEQYKIINLLGKNKRDLK